MGDRPTERRLLQFLLVALGLAAIGIGAMLFILGESFNHLSEMFFSALGGQPAPISQPVSPTIDSELRFYAPFWFSYGVLLIWVARGMMQRLSLVPILAAIFFAGGIGRVLSYLLVGPPHPLFTVLMVIELVYPILLTGLYVRLRR